VPLSARMARTGGTWWSTWARGPRRELLGVYTAERTTDTAVTVTVTHPAREAGRHALALVDAPTNQGPPHARQWLLVCPRCGARRRTLYAAPDAFAHGWRCRVCWRASYASTREGAEDRAWRRVRVLAERLEQPDPVPLSSVDYYRYGAASKPPRMHWRTFRRLDAELRRRAEWHACHLFATLALFLPDTPL
jgi:hypothetical protein